MRNSTSVFILPSALLFLCAGFLPGRAADPEPTGRAPFNVQQWGVKGDGTTDDTAALNSVLREAAKSGPGAEVVIPPGNYRLSGSLEIRKADRLTVRGMERSLFVMENADQPIVQLSDCRNLTIRALSFDRRPFLFTQGTITAVDPAGMTCTALIDAGYDEPDAPQLAEAGLYPFVYPETGTYDLTRNLPEIAGRQKKENGQWLFKLKGHAPVAEWKDKRFFFGHFGRGHCIEGVRLEDCLFEDINYWGGGGNAGLYLKELSGVVTFRRFLIGIPPRSNRMVSCAGGGQIGEVRGKLVFEDCDFTRIDDDGLDISVTWVRVLKQNGARTLTVQENRNFRRGDHVALWDWTHKKRRVEAVLTEATPAENGSFTLQLDRDVVIERAGAGDGKAFGYEAGSDGIDRVINLDTVGRETVIRNCRFQVFRAKCLNLKARNCTVEGCTFFSSWQPALFAAPEWFFQEGPPVRNLTVRNNRFLNCNHSNVEIGAGIGAGYDQPPPEAGPQLDSAEILIEGNSFAGYGGHQSVFGYWPIGDAVRVQNTSGVTIRRNHFGEAAPGPGKSAPLLVTDSGGVVIDGNEGLTDPAGGLLIVVKNCQDVTLDGKPLPGAP